MAEIIQMPKLGFDMKEGILVRWIKNESEEVTKGDVLAEIETDKATVEVESSVGGILFKQLVETDAIVPIGDPIAVIAEKGEEVNLEELLGKPEEPKTKAKDSTEKKQDAKIVEERNDSQPEDKESKDPQPEGEKGKDTQSDDEEIIKASPLAKKMAEDSKLDLSEIKGSGPGGRVVKKDIELALATKSEPDTPKTTKVDEPKKQVEKQDDGIALPSAYWGTEALSREDNRQPLNKLRQAISRRMVDSKQNIPHFYLTNKVNADQLMSVYKQVNETLPSDQKVSINDYVIKATALALREFPNLNASISDNDLIQHGNINIGVAVAIEGGLLTIVIRDADVKPLRVISQEVKELAARVRSGKVRSEDIEGSTFSISNLGMFNVEEFSAIINPPEVAILAVSSALKEPVVENDEVKISWQMKITISADHRATDGVEAAKFMKSIVFQLENPLRLLL
ncbi:MAG TPA: dihydrolipoamide acetyltransferase family protein [Anaerolineaceae bacterium]|nr:dihydrolipoamide acetyltransferase family protein [Anaerolineaceae bacterium]